LPKDARQQPAVDAAQVAADTDNVASG
jgi:hypothetical protein